MSDASRPLGRLFYLLPLIFVWIVLASETSAGQTPARTTISDVVYRADGTVEGGTLLLSWPAFSTAGGQAIAAGTTSAVLGSGGVLSVQLVPNVSATPSGTFYTVVYHLDDGTVKTEYWAVPTTSPTTIAAVRTAPGSSGQPSQLATQQFVNTALAGKANDSAVVHLNGSETITGAKQFAVAPSLPAPVLPTDAVNKGYVDSAVTTSGSGSFVSKAGDTMSGPLTLPSDPVAPNQASTKHYADIGLAAKAGLISGVVPTGQLGSGPANNSVCLHGDSTWGGCGSSSNAISIQGVPVDTSAPTDNQVITYSASQGKYQPKAGGGITAGMQAVKYATDFNWSQIPATDLSVAGAETVSLSVCPPGTTGTEPWYYVYVSGTGTAEAVLVTGGSCAGNGQAGTLQFTTANSHSAGYTIGSASGGLQEALVAARYTPTNPTGTSQAGKVVVPPGQFIAYARVSIRASGMTVDFSGSIVECWMNDSCIFVGDALNINAPSRAAIFQAIVREVEIEVKDLAEHSIYKIKFANDAAKSLAFEFDSAKVASALDVAAISNTQVGAVFLSSLTAAEITATSSATVTIDAGISPIVGGGFEVRWTDAGWGQGNNRNLAGRFSSQTFTLPRLARIQNYFVRQYDASVPPKYSRYSAALHLDYPL